MIQQLERNQVWKSAKPRVPAREIIRVYRDDEDARFDTVTYRLRSIARRSTAVRFRQWIERVEATVQV